MGEREEFEKRFPPPPGVEWSDKLNDYTYTDFQALGNVCKYSGQWQAWQAARAGGEPVGWTLWGSFEGGKRMTSPYYTDQKKAELAATRYGLELRPLYTHPPAKVPGSGLSESEWAEIIDRAVPDLSPEPDQSQYPTEWALWSDRQRIRQELASAAPCTPEPPAKVPEWVYDGYSVYSRLSEKAKARTSPENVSDTLDAIKAMLTNPPQQEGV